MDGQADDLERHARRNVRRRTGALARSLEADVRVSGGMVKARLTSDHPAARIQDEGGRVRARGRRLAVPIGSVRVHPRSVPGLFLMRARSGKRFLATKQGGAIRLWFRLMDEVQIRGNQYAQRALAAVDAQVPSALLDRVHRRVT